uniref:NADH dehydrogenase subunit 6 n=1 Tax=Cordax unidentatus TaxID=3021430 RepID=UPI0030FE105E|nr:NADH dehydrogenase subunit 6 [Cordax unidentatus]
MLKTSLLFLSIWSCCLFVISTHPLSMGLTLLVQTFVIALISGFATQTFWMSYVLFLVFLGGMLVLFLYVTSLASNELFTIKPLTLMIGLLLSSTITLALLWSASTLDFSSNSTLHNELSLQWLSFPQLSLNAFYSLPTAGTTIFLAWYLLMALLIVAKIINVNEGPLRSGC